MMAIVITVLHTSIPVRDVNTQQESSLDLIVPEKLVVIIQLTTAQNDFEVDVGNS
jgi:hypothetical protein